MTKKDLQSSAWVGNGEKKEDTNWSDLPNLIAWMIKARLDFPNNLRFAAVCKSWQQASLSYPVHYQFAREEPPWTMITRDIATSQREFLNISTGEKYTLDLSDFCRTIALYSNQGWLLLVKVKCIELKFSFRQTVDTHNIDSPFFLLNPFTKAKITLPSIKCITEPYGAFTIDNVDGNPQRVVLVSTSLINRGVLPCMDLYVACVGDDAWTKHSSTTWQLPASVQIVPQVIIARQMVYWFDERCRVYAFNLLNSEYQGPAEIEVKISSKKSRFYIMESRGEVYMVRHTEGENGGGSFPMFYKLNTRSSSNACWEQLNSEELNDKSWFLNSPEYQCFVWKEKGSNEIFDRGCWNLTDSTITKKFQTQLNTAHCKIITDWVDMR